ncbi:MAG: DNA recombination protein RmuC [Puniceicoccales bacterium]|jgi:DNA recombination protein RmuC|nr:DNA recombination protein RmuC [Puniceicoccales bacterium]
MPLPLEYVSWAIFVLVGIGIAYLAHRLRRVSENAAALAKFVADLAAAQNRVEQNIRSELANLLVLLRTELVASIDRATQNQRQHQDTTRTEIIAHLEKLRAATLEKLDGYSQRITDILAKTRTELTDSANAARTDTRAQFGEFQKNTAYALENARSAQNQQLTDFATRLAQLQSVLAEALAQVRQTLDSRLDSLAAQNTAKLEEMRLTVDEKLQSTLEKRLGENFRLVGENLEKVTRSLGEMRQMAVTVGDLKRVLTNVKTRGTWGEYQLANLLEQLLTHEQYAANVAIRPDSTDRVEFAIRLPGNSSTNTPVWLPIDAKFPIEDYERLAIAAEHADTDGVATATKALVARVTDQAKLISQKYIVPPHSTDFAILFLPTEGLYAELLRQPGLVSDIQRAHHVTLAGPTTLAALLNSLQMGFRTLAVEQRAGEVWKVLGSVKTEFGKFGEILDKVQKKLESASKEIEQTGVRSRAIERKLRNVETLPAPTETADDTAQQLLHLEEVPAPSPPPDTPHLPSM